MTSNNAATEVGGGAQRGLFLDGKQAIHANSTESLAGGLTGRVVQDLTSGRGGRRLVGSSPSSPTTVA
jgi:hypothetical protein